MEVETKKKKNRSAKRCRTAASMKTETIAFGTLGSAW